MQKIPTMIALAAISLSGVACKTNKTAKNDPYNSAQPHGGSQDPYASAGEYDNVYASGGGQSYDGASADSYGSDDYYNTASSDPYTPPADSPSQSGGAASGGGAASAGAGSHTVEKGDTLFNISRRFGTTVGALQSANGLNGNLIRIGERLVIP